VAANARCDAQRELEAWVAVHDGRCVGAVGRERNGVLLAALHLRPKAFAVRNQKAQVANLRGIDARVIDLVEDAAPDREPNARRAERAADHLLRTAAPGGGNTRGSSAK